MALLFTGACTVPVEKKASFANNVIELESHLASRTALLRSQLINLASDSAKHEADIIADTCVRLSRRLAAKYEVVKPALWHNILVNLGFKERGLCWHYAEDLINELKRLNLEHYDFYWAVAHQGSYFFEHNAVVVTPSGKKFEDGLVLDAWRNCGEIYWAQVSKDKYPWRILGSDN